jgi:hypothetical protein
MLKLLLILAAAAAIATAAHSTPLEFQDPEDSNADLLLADVADELDLDDGLDLNDEVDLNDGLDLNNEFYERAADPETEADEELDSDDELDSSVELDTKKRRFGTSIRKVAQKLAAGMKKAASGAKNGLKKSASGVKKGFKKAASSVKKGFKKAASGVKKGLKKAASSVKKGLKKAAGGVKNAYNRMRKFHCPPKVETIVADSGCPLGQINKGGACEQCPEDKPATSYGSVDGSKCQSCRQGSHFDKQQKICVDASEKNDLGVLSDFIDRVELKSGHKMFWGETVQLPKYQQVTTWCKVPESTKANLVNKAAEERKRSKVGQAFYNFGQKVKKAFKSLWLKTGDKWIKDIKKSIARKKTRKAALKAKKLELWRSKNCPKQPPAQYSVIPIQHVGFSKPICRYTPSNTAPPAPTNTPTDANSPSASNPPAKNGRPAGRSPAKIPMSVINFCKTRPKGKKQRVCIIIENLQMQGLLQVHDDTPADSDTPSVDLQTTGCSAGQTCCLQGWYGAPPNCVQCPSATPSSPRTASGGPDENCNCPNAAASSCFACSNPICRPFNPSTGICTLVCPNCSVQRINNVLKPKCN